MNYSPAELLGRFDYTADSGFVNLPESVADDATHFVRCACAEAILDMHAAAQADAISLKVISSSRNFGRQCRIWENKWNGITLTEGINLAEAIDDPVERARKILRFSAMPGTSRHHWGTDVDFNEVEDEYFLHGKGKDEYAWLVENAGRFGFVQPYTSRDSGRTSGYEEEKWHWSFLPLSRIFIGEYVEQIDYSLLSGFSGAETASILNVIDEYVCGINPVCLPGRV